MSGLTLAIADGVATLTLDRPAARNAATLAIWRDLPEACARIAAQDDARIAVLRGAGDKAFCAGADVAEFPEVFATPDSGRAYNDAMRAGLNALAALPKPSIACIRGACIGAGLALALACDLRFAAEGSGFALPPARLGAVYPYPDIARLVAAIGPARAKDMLFSARIVGGPEALAFGLVDRLLPGHALEAAVAAYAAEAAALSATSIAAGKAMIAAAVEQQESAAMRALADDAFAGEDFREGYKAFLEKRKPAFR